MTRLSLFDAEGAEPNFQSVSALTEQIKSTLEADFAQVALRAEVSNVARPSSGHIYLALKDDAASIRATLWKNDARLLDFDLVNGLAVKVWGRVTVYPPRGDYQLSIRRIEPDGIGELERLFRETAARLKAEGLFDPARKKPLPRFPRRIVVVTSPTGAAVRDFLQVTGRRWPLTEILIAPTRVQGAGSVEEVVAALALANQVADADLIVVTRGGGSLEDLWTFNEESVARAIAASRLPVVSAIGHEVDITIADLVADRRALTPSEAGELGVPELREIAQRLDLLGDRLAIAGRRRIDDARHILERLADRLNTTGQRRIDDARRKLERLSDRAATALRRLLDDRRHRVARLAAELEALSPLGVLARGYSLTTRDDRTTLVRKPGDVRPGDLIRTRLAGGEILSRVETE